MTRAWCAAFTVLVLAQAGTAHAWCRMTTSMIPSTPGACVTDGIPLYWAQRCTSYRFFEDGTPDMSWEDLRTVAQLSFGAWHDATCPSGVMPGLSATEGVDAAGAPQVSYCGQAEYNQNQPNVSTIVFVRDWGTRDYDPNAYAVTTVWHNIHTAEIYDVDMEYNEQHGPFTRCGDAPCTDMRVDLQDVMTHEAGHWFGMAHSTDPTSTMYASAPPGEISKRTLEADDIAGFCDAYEHPAVPFGTSCDPTPRGGLKLTCGDTACMPDSTTLAFTSGATGALGADAPPVCHGGAPTCGVAEGGRGGAPSLLALVGVMVLARARRRAV